MRPTGRTGRPRPAAQATRILVVDDERVIREPLVEHLQGEGYTTDPAGTIAEAQAHIAARLLALIVLDLMLPGHSGWDFLRDRRRDPVLSAIPVLVLSAAPPDRLLDAKALGADAFLSKPFALDVLGATVRGFGSRLGPAP